LSWTPAAIVTSAPPQFAVSLPVPSFRVIDGQRQSRRALQIRREQLGRHRRL
jgi:hypothetical protein